MANRSFAAIIPTWRRPKALTKLFKKCPALNSPSTYVGMEKADVEAYKPWREELGDQCTIVPVKNPNHYPSNAQQQIKEAIELDYYRSVVFLDDNTSCTSEALGCLVYAHSLWPKDIMTGTNPIGTFYHKDAMEQGEKVSVPTAWQKLTKTDTITIFDQMNMTFWAMPASIYEEFDYYPNNYAWDIEVVMWAIVEGGVRNLKGCVEASFEKHKHDNKETHQHPAYKLQQLGESISILAQRYPEYAKPIWMTYRVDLHRVLKAKRQEDNL